ncbi:hypothetical protein CAF53_12085 [Sphingobium sp. LB126]|nr:hypothetical protein CAF53_12085 [Sphingobium sp. LB126]
MTIIAILGAGLANTQAPSFPADALYAPQPQAVLPEAHLRAAIQDDQVRSFYAAAGWRAVWTTAAEQELLAALDGRARHGLDRIDFGTPPSSSDSTIDRELNLTRLALAYASALAHGVVDPAALHSIYFDCSERHLSHGCVRVEDALGFAQLLASDEGVLDQWLAARESGQERFVDLPREIPVRLLYRNVFVRSSGAIAFRTDPYGWNDAVAQRLGFNSKGRKSQPEAIDIGP